MISVSNLFIGSWKLLKTNWVVIVLVQLIYLAGYLLSNLLLHPGLNYALEDILSSLFKAPPKDYGVTSYVINFLITVAITAWSTAALTHIIASQGKNPSLTDVSKAGMSRLWPVSLAILLGVLIVAGGSVLLIIPGILFMVWFYFAVYILIVEKVGVIEAFKRSKSLIKGRWWQVFWRLLIPLMVVMLMVVVNYYFNFYKDYYMINVLVSSFLIYPLSIIYGYLLYKDLKTRAIPANS